MTRLAPACLTTRHVLVLGAMLRPWQFSRVAALVLGLTLLAGTSLLVSLGSSSLLLHEHDGSGHHVHALRGPDADAPATWNARHARHHQREQHEPDASAPRSSEPALGSMPAGFVLHVPGSWSELSSFDHGRWLRIGQDSRSPETVCRTPESRSADLERREWPPPRGEPSGVLALLRKSHALLI